MFRFNKVLAAGTGKTHLSTNFSQVSLSLYSMHETSLGLTAHRVPQFQRQRIVRLPGLESWTPAWYADSTTESPSEINSIHGFNSGMFYLMLFSQFILRLNLKSIVVMLDKN